VAQWRLLNPTLRTRENAHIDPDLPSGRVAVLAALATRTTFVIN